MHARFARLPILRITTAICVTAVLLLTSHARADTLSATRGQRLSEIGHDVRIRVRDGIATYKVRRTFKNDGKRHEEAVLDLGLPFGAAATGLRIKTPSGWYAGELMRAERAERIYRELTGFGPHTVKDPALLSWRWANELNLRVFPVAPGGGESTLEYTLTGPTRYENGRYVVSYPMADGRLATPQLRVLGHDPTAKAWLNGKPILTGSKVALSPPELPTWAESEKFPESFASSDIVIPEKLTAKKLSIAVDVRHTFRGDLRVQLVAPDGTWRALIEPSGGQANDVRANIDVVLSETAAVSVKGTWRLVVSDHAALDVGTIDAWSISLQGGAKNKKFAASDTPKFVPDAPSGAAGNMGVIQVTPPPMRTLAARLGRVEASKNKQFFRLEIDAAPQLRSMPRNIHVVFVIDASKSIGSEGLDAQLTVAKSFLRNAPKAKAEFVLYRRHARRLFGDFVPAHGVGPRLAKAETNGLFTLGNGSALDEGVRVAGRALGSQRGSRMIVMLNDNLLRPAWHNKTALDLLANIPLHAAHVVMPQIHDFTWVGDARELRDDKHALAPLALRSGGILLRIDNPGEHDKELDSVTLGLVRPTRIDQFQVHGVALPATHTIPTVLHEGQGVREMAALTVAPSRVRLSGKIWARAFSREVNGPLAFSRATAAFVFSHDMHQDLTIEEQVRVAFAGRVVSPVTSYLAVEPGVRPSDVGLTGTGFGGGGRGEGLGLASVSTVANGGGTCPAYDIKTDVASAANACIRAHKPAKGWSVNMRVFTTYDEVVDVVPGGHKASALTGCLVDAVWTAALSTCRFDARRDHADVHFP